MIRRLVLALYQKDVKIGDVSLETYEQRCQNVYAGMLGVSSKSRPWEKEDDETPRLLQIMKRRCGSVPTDFIVRLLNL